MTWVMAAVDFLGPTGTALVASSAMNLLGGSNQANAAGNAANLQYQATQNAAQQQREMFNTLNEQQKPYREAGYGALSKIQDMLPQFTRQFTPADLQANLAPNYEFMKQQGLGAVSQAGNVSSPGSNVDLARTKFAENYAQNAYQDALNNWRNQQSDIYNRLSNLAGIGQTGQAQTNTLGSNTTNALSQLALGGASALGAGQIGAANAYANSANNIGNMGMLYSMLKPQITSPVANEVLWA
jgi:hypothetical protein